MKSARAAAAVSDAVNLEGVDPACAALELMRIEPDTDGEYVSVGASSKSISRIALSDVVAWRKELSSQGCVIVADVASADEVRAATILLQEDLKMINGRSCAGPAGGRACAKSRCLARARLPKRKTCVRVYMGK